MMMIPQTLTSERSTHPSVARACLRTTTLCLVGLLGAVACSGSIDENQDVASARPAPTEASGNTVARNPISSSAGTSTAAARGAGDTDTASERDDDDIGRDDGSRVNTGGRRRGGGGTNDPDRTEDAGGVDAGEIDAGGADGGAVDVDAGVDVDGGLTGDAGIR